MEAKMYREWLGNRPEETENRIPYTFLDRKQDSDNHGQEGI